MVVPYLDEASAWMPVMSKETFEFKLHTEADILNFENYEAENSDAVRIIGNNCVFHANNYQSNRNITCRKRT